MATIQQGWSKVVVRTHSLSGYHHDDVSAAMGPVINLRTERKRAKRRAAEQEAAERRTAFGRSKAQANLERGRNDKAKTRLDQHRIETGDLE